MNDRQTAGGGSDKKPDQPDTPSGGHPTGDHLSGGNFSGDMALTGVDRWTLAQIVRATLTAHRDRVEADKHKPGDEGLVCERCGSIRRPVATLPPTADLPEVTVLQCAGCEIIDLMRP